MVVKSLPCKCSIFQQALAIEEREQATSQGWQHKNSLYTDYEKLGDQYDKFFRYLPKRIF